MCIKQKMGELIKIKGENKMIKLAELKRGQVFNLGGYEWLVVEHDETEWSTLVTTTECISEMSFDKNNSNDFRNSSLRNYLNSDFIEELEDGGLDIDDIIYTDFDLTGNQGGDYGICRDLVGLLTEEQYKEHKDILVINDWWWLITSHSSYSHSVRRVCTDCSLNHSPAYHGFLVVRPVLTLNSETEVSVEQRHKGLEGYSSEELLQELLRRVRC